MQEKLNQLYRQVVSKYYGKYRGFVVERDDPQQKGRLRVRVPAVLGEEESGWALPCFPCGGLDGVGSISIPELDAQVWVEFEGGEVDLPIWTGTFYGENDAMPEEALQSPPDTQVVRLPVGHVLELCGVSGDEKIRLEHSSGSKLEMDKDGNVTILDQAGSTVQLSATDGKITCEESAGSKLELSSSAIKLQDTSGCEIELSGGSVTITGAAQITLDAPFVNLGGSGGEGVLKGQSFLTAYMVHTHPTGVGPSGPPIPTSEMAALSMNVKSV